MTRNIIASTGFLFCLYFLFFFFIVSCDNTARNSGHPEISLSSIKKGKALAALYCQSCHLLPDPALLDSKTWEENVLPTMGPRLGIFNFKGVQYPAYKNDITLSPDYYPSKPLIKQSEWQNIIDYYVASSPDNLYVNENEENKIEVGLPGFVVKKPSNQYSTPAISFLKISKHDTRNELVINDALNQHLYRFDSGINIIDSFETKKPIVDIEFEKDKWIACNIGILTPNNGRYGKVESFHQNSNGKIEADSSVLFTDLARPVHASAVDLNKDGKMDYLICEFGYLTGALSWMENLDNQKYMRHVLRPYPGAIKAIVDDYNRDGLPDLWVLFAQGEEGIFLFTNKGNGKFEEKEVLRFSPLNGSSYFEMADFNNDGYADIVYTCGDNADYTKVLKPYHGVYIFINNGSNQFKQDFFYHINGCYKAIARDYDNDGDLDIATISFFADYTHRPEEGFVYLQNNGDLKFKGFTFPEAQQGRWLTMDAGDLDGDKKIDLVLGNFSIGPVVIKSSFDWTSGTPFIFLKNIGKSKNK